jgi:hypothetical protein
MRIHRLVLLSVLSLGLINQARAADNYTILDGNRSPVTFRSKDTGAGQIQQVVPSDATGLPYSQSNPQYMNLLLNGSQLGIGPNVKANSLPVALPTDPDVRPTSGTISAADAISATVAGQNNVSIITGAPTANSYVSQAVNGISNASIQLSGVWLGAVVFEDSIDGGTTWAQLRCNIRGNANAPLNIRSATANGMFSCEAAGATNIRVRATAWTSGTAVVTMTFTAFPGALTVINKITEEPNAVNSTDFSGTIATGGSYQTAIAAPVSPAAMRRGCLIQNPTTASEVLNVKFGTMAQPYTLLPGDHIGCTIGSQVLQDAVTVMAATLGHAYAATAQ